MNWRTTGKRSNCETDTHPQNAAGRNKYHPIFVSVYHSQSVGWLIHKVNEPPLFHAVQREVNTPTSLAPGGARHLNWIVLIVLNKIPLRNIQVTKTIVLSSASTVQVHVCQVGLQAHTTESMIISFRAIEAIVRLISVAKWEKYRSSHPPADAKRSGRQAQPVILGWRSVNCSTTSNNICWVNPIGCGNSNGSRRSSVWLSDVTSNSAVSWRIFLTALPEAISPAINQAHLSSRLCNSLWQPPFYLLNMTWNLQPTHVQCSAAWKLAQFAFDKATHYRQPIHHASPWTISQLIESYWNHYIDTIHIIFTIFIAT